MKWNVTLIVNITLSGPPLKVALKNAECFGWLLSTSPSGARPEQRRKFKVTFTICICQMTRSAGTLEIIV